MDKLTPWKGSSYLHTIHGGSFSLNPLSLTTLDSALTSGCSSTFSVQPITSNAVFENFPQDVPVYPITNYTFHTHSVAETIVNNFTTNSDYCLTLRQHKTDKSTVQISLFPNPASTKLNIRTPDNTNVVSLTITDIYGKQTLINASETIDISHLTRGVYFLSLVSNEGEFHQKFIKE